ncbi:hypothetical protein LR48_Vigan404s003600 [Vigna angularis]|uniref:Uncharacterized protein n=1 Tax=Phaseolus angularis TaxID=3914 RepID=A0A0L9T998_PHAAN|nr:hypothetical protein LR48_Vigan404s003600 [Vigna angularis]
MLWCSFERIRRDQRRWICGMQLIFVTRIKEEIYADCYGKTQRKNDIVGVDGMKKQWNEEAAESACVRAEEDDEQ